MIAPYDFATPDYILGVQLRDRVLRQPLGRSINDDPLGDEYDQIHFGAWSGDLLVGTASLVQTDAGLKMRQVAVDPSVQSQGFGAQLVKACEAFAKTQNVCTLYCHARITARKFYEQCGWEVKGDVFTEVGIDHFKMYAPLSDPAAQ